jgi:hypothetical protein
MINDNDVIGAIADLIEASIKNGTEAVTVYEGIPNHATVFPYISIRPVGWKETYQDLRDTEIEATYAIDCYINIADTTLDAQTDLRNIVNDTVNLLGLQTNITLGGLVDYSNLTAGSYLFDQKEASLYFCEITYTVTKKYNRYV